MSSPHEGKNLRVSVPPGKGGVRVDRFLADALEDMSRNRVQALIDAGEVKINESVIRERKTKINVHYFFDHYK